MNAEPMSQVMRKAFALGSDNTWLKAKGQVDYNTQSQKARRAEQGPADAVLQEAAQQQSSF